MSTANTPSRARVIALNAADDAFGENCRFLQKMLFQNIAPTTPGPAQQTAVERAVESMRRGMNAARLAYAEAVKAAAEIPQ